MTEIEYQKAFVEIANKRGAHAVLVRDHLNVGIPDINLAIHGDEWWLEAKKNNGKVSGQQDEWMRKRTKAGGKCVVIRFREVAGEINRIELDGAAMMYFDGGAGDSNDRLVNAVQGVLNWL